MVTLKLPYGWTRNTTVHMAVARLASLDIEIVCYRALDRDALELAYMPIEYKDEEWSMNYHPLKSTHLFDACLEAVVEYQKIRKAQLKELQEELVKIEEVIHNSVHDWVDSLE